MSGGTAADSIAPPAAAERDAEDHIRTILETVPDPEIPVLSVLDLGIVRAIRVRGERVEVDLTPTYSGCPATHAIEADVARALRENGYPGAVIRVVLAPAWTTDWISAAGRRKLSEYGIAPPAQSSMDKDALLGARPPIACPQCAATNTEKLSEFGSTPCKALYRCRSCLEPFDYFKCI